MTTSTARTPRILAITNEGPDWPDLDKQDANAAFQTLLAGLEAAGYACRGFTFFDDLTFLDDFDPRDWLVWNWGEELAGRPWSDADVADEIARRGFTYTGASAELLRFTQDRLLVKQRLQAAGLPTPPGAVLRDPAAASTWTTFPAIVKGANQHASVGIDGNSVVHTTAELAARVQHLRREHGDDALVESFLDSREFHVGVWGNDQPEALPPVEIDYSRFPDMHDRLYTEAWKSDRASRGFGQIATSCPAPIDRPDWRARLESVAVGAYRALGLRDYARLDLRMLGDEPQVLDVNVNPDLQTDGHSAFVTAAAAAGFDYSHMVKRIVELAAQRHRLRVLSPPAQRVLGPES